jgi:hypothetical protein
MLKIRFAFAIAFFPCLVTARADEAVFSWT